MVDSAAAAEVLVGAAPQGGGEMNFKRVIQHLSSGRAVVRRVFPRTALDAIERAISTTETQHDGQIRFAVEAGLDVIPLLAGQSAQQRAIEVFSQLGIWDTENNNGVLIYLLLADRDVEIIADRGVNAKLGKEVWEQICHAMETSFREGKFEQGVIDGIHSISRLLAQHYPPVGFKANELADQAVVL